MERVSVLWPRDSPELLEIAEELRQEGWTVWTLREGDTSQVVSSQVGAAVVDATRTPAKRVLELVQAWQARKALSVHAPMLVLVSDAESGAQWLAQGVDDFSLEPRELLWRLRSRLRSLSQQLDVMKQSRSLSLRAAVELTLGEATRLLDTEQLRLWVGNPAREHLRCFIRTHNTVIEQPSPADDEALALRKPGLQIYTRNTNGRPSSASDAEADSFVEAIQRRLETLGASAALTLRLEHQNQLTGALLAYLPTLPHDEVIESLRSLSTKLAQSLAGASSLEETFLSRYRELLETNRHLRELDHAKEEFLALCAHDLRSPLTALMSQAQLLAQGTRGELPGPALAAVDAVLRQGRKMAELIHSLLGERALSTGTLELHPEEVDLSSVLSEILEEALPAAQQRGVALLSEGLTGGPRVSIDPARLHEAIGNLLSNAIKFTPPGGRVELSLQPNAGEDGSGVQVTVRDTGPGIPPEELPLVFERYRRGRVGKEQGLGMGLGLALAREVVRLHGGVISVQSTLGQGTRFRVWLPKVAHTPQGNQPSHASQAGTGENERSRVLLVEDDEELRGVMAELLRERFEVREATNGEEAVSLARQLRPDVVLMDLFMPRRDGFSALEDLRRDPRTAELPVIFLSGQSDEGMKVRALDRGAADYLVKPVSPRELLARVERAVKLGQQSAQIKVLNQTDALTGLPNYGAFRIRLAEELKRAGRYRTPLSAVMIDLDHLKQLNDAFGHELGNRAIVALAEQVRTQLRTTDFAARFGGDEFVVLLPHTRPDEAAVFAERVRTALTTRQLQSGQQSVQLRASFGVAALPTEGSGSVDEVLRSADEALYRAKRNGRDQVCIEDVASGG
jgi:diguanylate cyclase (GGDEF)-like protein